MGRRKLQAGNLHPSVPRPPRPPQGCGAANRRRLVAVHCDRAASFESIHGLLNRLMEVLSVPYTGGGQAHIHQAVHACCRCWKDGS